MSNEVPVLRPWPLWHKILFRFLFIYLILYTEPWTWADEIGGTYVTKYYHSFINWIVNLANTHIFHLWDELIPINGSGDTSFSWTQVLFYLLLASAGCFIWSIIDRRRRSYDRADYWLRTFVRYFIAANSLIYGIIKIFALQMRFPNISQLATPLGDFLPMRFSWLFIGYSTQYQIFSGIMELLAGLLLLNRRTVTLGLLFASGVFMNVVLLNLSYDIPVKLLSMHILFMCIYLMAHDARRLTSFFILNKPVPRMDVYDVTFPKRWSRITRIGFKILFVIIALIKPLINSYDSYQSAFVKKPVVKPFRPGLYDVSYFVMNGDTIAPLLTDSLRWRDVAFENVGTYGSISTTDTLFRSRYGRGYFLYKQDTVNHSLEFLKSNSSGKQIKMFKLYYTLPDDKSISLYGNIRRDFVYIGLAKSKKHFQLTERQFHWLSERIQ